ncbi:MAG: hypothetical protein M3O31_02095 [Acidobacteriota bacterium]|nr:hypothetical protein [Acidobacteriota bacterium]
MATTLRKTTASPAAVRDGLPRLSRGQYKYHTVNYLERQEGSGVLEAVIPLIATAKIAADLHAQGAGSTVSIGGRNMAGTARFAVSIYPERSAELAIPLSWEFLFAFAVINADLLLLPDHALGTWFDNFQKQHVLDVVACLSSLSEAIHLGRRKGQRAIFDLQIGKVITLQSAMDTTAEHFSSEGN